MDQVRRTRQTSKADVQPDYGYQTQSSADTPAAKGRPWWDVEQNGVPEYGLVKI